jgi:putative DNA primase/helicase
MVDVTKLFGGPLTLAPKNEPPPIEHQVADAMQAAGLTPPHPIIFDGRLHRFRSGTKGQGGHGDRSGWYVLYSDGVPAGKFGCWRSGAEVNWRADIGRQISPVEEMAHARRLAEAKAARDAELAKSREVAASTVDYIWAKATPASAEHPYLLRKGVQPHGARITGDGRLIVPLYGSDGNLSSLQYISHDGGKLYHAGGATTGKYWQVGVTDDPGPIYIAEGFATAATIHEVMGRPCIVAYSASNLVPVTGEIRERFGATQEIIVVADNDASGTGQKYADQASAKHGARVVTPPVQGDANDYVQAGNDLMALLVPQPDDWLVTADSLCSVPAPISWLVKRWFQSQALMMVHGPSGVGKTFVVMDMCLRIASGMADWASYRVKAGAVVYLAGEGHYGIRGRIAAWRERHKPGPLRMWVSKHGCDLNTAQGYQKATDAIRALPEVPAIVVVDTLHRFLAGDENSAQDAKTMIDACDRIKQEFGCSVLLVHHTGVSDEAQHRARGSSAWRGALDIEVSVTQPDKDGPIKIEPRKIKDGEEPEPLHCELERVNIPGWLDEDGEQVSSAVVTFVPGPPPRAKTDSKFEANRKLFEAAWWSAGAEMRDEMPYLSRSGLKLKLRENGVTEPMIEKILKPKQTSELIGSLLAAEIIRPLEHGWVVIAEAHASAMRMRRENTSGPDRTSPEQSGRSGEGAGLRTPGPDPDRTGRTGDVT